jgi:chromosome segregation ATPase
MKARDQVVRGLVETAGLGVAFTPYDEMRADFRKQRASHREQEEKLGKELGDARVQLEKTGKDWEEKLALADKAWKEKLNQAQATIEHLKTEKLEADGQLTAKADELQKQQQQISDLQQQLRELTTKKADAEAQSTIRQQLIEQLKTKAKPYELKTLSKENPIFTQFLADNAVTPGG